MSDSPLRIAVIGAGPIGLEAALLAVQSGFDAQVYEQGRVGENIRDWGHVQLFSPFGLNSTERGRHAVASMKLSTLLPDSDEFLTGREYLEQYLLPLGQQSKLKGRIHEGVEVRAISRTKTWKGDLIGNPSRCEDPFRLLLRDAFGERTAEADYVLDCSGTYGNHNWIGAGGIPCLGETICLAEEDYLLPDILGRNRDVYLGQTTLVIGSGYSAATAVVTLAKLAEVDPTTRIIWLTRSEKALPIVRVENDSLLERDQLSRLANRLATDRESPVEWLSGYLVHSIKRIEGRGPFLIEVGHRSESNPEPNGTLQTKQIRVDRVIANVGYRPDRRIYEELQVHECYATQGPIKLAAALLGETSEDCLAQSSHGAEILRNPEPGFFILGAKSYGRDSRFLIKIGLDQIQEVFSMIEADVRFPTSITKVGE